MEYKGYVAAIAYDDYADVLHGRVINAADYSIVTFEASDVEGLKREFAISIDEYLASCEEDGVEPEKPYSGKVELKIGPKLHRTNHSLGPRRRHHREFLDRERTGRQSLGASAPRQAA